MMMLLFPISRFPPFLVSTDLSVAKLCASFIKPFGL